MVSAECRKAPAAQCQARKIRHLDWRNTNLNGSDFRNVDFEFTDFSGARLSGANVSEPCSRRLI